MNKIKYMITLALMSLLFSGCGDKGYGTQEITVVPSVTSSEPVRIVDAIPHDGGLVAQRAFINVAFSSYIDQSSVNRSTVRLLDVNSSHEVSIAFYTIRNFIFVKPLESLVDGESYQLKIEGLKDIFDNDLAQSYALSFRCESDFWETVYAGDVNSMAKSKAGDLYIWGSNAPLPIDTTEKESVYLTIEMPMPIPNLPEVQSFSTNTYDMAVITKEGGLMVIGAHAYSDLEAEDYLSVRVGSGHIVVLKKDGTIFSWGSNAKGQLGVIKIFDQSEPIQEASEDDNWTMVSAQGDFTVALKKDGTLWAWGDNLYGQAGGTYERVLLPKEINTTSTSVSVWEKVSAGYAHGVAIGRDKTLWSWGSNSDGELGDGTYIKSSTPQQEDSAKQWLHADAGYGHTLAISDVNDTLWSWGKNSSGQLGDDSTVSSNVPREISGGWQGVSAGNNYSLGVKKDGTLWAWGTNFGLRLGVGPDVAGSSVPMEVR